VAGATSRAEERANRSLQSAAVIVRDLPTRSPRSAALVIAAVVLGLVAMFGLPWDTPRTATPGDETVLSVVPAVENNEAASNYVTDRSGAIAGNVAVVASQSSGVVTGSALDMLDLLAVEPEHDGGYARDLFGSGWLDMDTDGCDTRKEVLVAESVTPVRIGSGCELIGGAWSSAYDGLEITDASDLDIDHVVPLKEAWDSGAWAWPSTLRARFANDLDDPRSLRAVTAATNRSKGSSDLAGWLPPERTFTCDYAIDWVATKVRWSLSVDPIEADAARTILASCPAGTVAVKRVASGG
jgi:hypothetical protein